MNMDRNTCTSSSSVAGSEKFVPGKRHNKQATARNVVYLLDDSTVAESSPQHFNTSPTTSDSLELLDLNCNGIINSSKRRSYNTLRRSSTRNMDNNQNPRIRINESDESTSLLHSQSQSSEQDSNGGGDGLHRPVVTQHRIRTTNSLFPEEETERRRKVSSTRSVANIMTTAPTDSPTLRHCWGGHGHAHDDSCDLKPESFRRGSDSRRQTFSSRPYNVERGYGAMGDSGDYNNSIEEAIRVDERNQVMNDHNTIEEQAPGVSCGYYTPHMRDRLRRRIKYYFMSPIDKWKVKRRWPWKLGVQFIKIFFVTLQILIFGMDMSRIISHHGNMLITFKEIFLEGWDPSREVVSFPPSAGPFAVYSVDDFYHNINHAIFVYSNITDYAIGNFDYATGIDPDHPGYHPVGLDRAKLQSSKTVRVIPEPPAPNVTMSSILFEKVEFEYGDATPGNFFYNYSNSIITRQVFIGEIYPPGDKRWKSWKVQDYLDSVNETINFDRILQVRLTFPLRTIYLNSLNQWDKPECYSMNVHILYDNAEHDGQIVISLDATSARHECHGDVNDKRHEKMMYIVRQLVNWIVIILSAVSILLCLRSLLRGQIIKREAQHFFRLYFGQALSWSECLEFVDFWYIMIIVNDVCIIVGSFIKIRLEQRLVEDPTYVTCSILLGVGNLLVWAGLLRYLGFFHKYNLLIVTMKRALPHTIRFASCTMLLYGGFVLAGWVVLGPFHPKYRTLSSTSETLFSLINGDDMFATFSMLESKNPVIWYFSRIYEYLFVFLFIYVVLSLFIAIIMDSYESIKEFYTENVAETRIQKFIGEVPLELSNTFFDPSTIEEEQLRNANTPLWRRVINYIIFCPGCLGETSPTGRFRPSGPIQSNSYGPL